MMKKLLAIVIASFALCGCERPDGYRVVYGQMEVEEQMKILQCLEANGWQHIGICQFQGGLIFTATREGEVK